MTYTLRVQSEKNLLRIPDKLGKGFFSAYNLPEGLSVMMSDCIFHGGLSLHRLPAINQQYFILHFHEAFNEGMIYNEDINQMHVYTLYKNIILLTSSLMENTFIIPEKVRVRSVRIIFGINFLNNFIG